MGVTVLHSCPAQILMLVSALAVILMPLSGRRPTAHTAFSWPLKVIISFRPSTQTWNGTKTKL